jgi:RNA polymerase sigma-70 factor (ECF subfamily)
VVSREEAQMQVTNAQATGESRPEVGPGHEIVRQFDDALLRCLPAFHRRAFRYLGNTADAEDAVQDALLSAYKHLNQFSGKAQMSTWLTSIVTNSARMQLRRRSGRVQVSLDERLGEEGQYSLSEQVADENPTPEDRFRESELLEHINQLLEQISPRLRTALQLLDLEGLTTEEAAAVLGIPKGTVKTQVGRARAKLRRLMRSPLNANLISAPTRTPRSAMNIKAKSPHATSTPEFAFEQRYRDVEPCADRFQEA